MSKPAVPDQPDDQAPPAAVPTACVEQSDMPVALGASPPDLEAELQSWAGFDRTQRRVELQSVIRRTRTARPEVLVRESIRAHAEADRQMLNLAFEALSKSVTPLLLSQAIGLARDERQEQAQQVLLELFGAIKEGKAEFAAKRFAAYSKRRAISLWRSRRACFEGANTRIEANDDGDPLADAPARIPSVEARSLLECAEAQLSAKLRDVFIQYHHFGLTQEEIADLHGVTARTVRTWLKDAEAAIGYSGEANAR